MKADTIFYNGTILTVDKNFSVAQAVAIKSNKILKVGTDEMVNSFDCANKIDLKGKTMMPGIIDAHGHLGMALKFANWADLTSKNYYDPQIFSVDEIMEKLKDHRKSHELGSDKLVLGFGYHESMLKEKRSITKFDLDKVSTTQPVIISNLALHIFSFNSVALKNLNINENTVDPAGSKIFRVDNSNEPNGVIQGPLAQQLVFNLSAETDEMKIKGFEKVQEEYLSYGITTVQEGKSTEGDLSIIDLLIKNNKIKIDIVSYVDYTAIEDALKLYDYEIGTYKQHFKIAGPKIISDGTLISGAFLTEPFIGTDNYGIEYCTKEELEKVIRMSLENNWQFAIHAMGDAAIDKLLNIYSSVAAEKKIDLHKYRNTIVHGSTVREDQLDRIKDLNLMLTLYPSATAALYEAYCMTIGKKRADRSNPVKSAMDKGIVVTLHNDAPIIGPDPFIMLWSAVNRVSVREKISFGQEQRISVEEAIKALTINVAYQYFEEKEKGSIEKGKLADLIVIDRNPLEIDTSSLGEIKVLKTIKDGNIVFEL